MKDGLSFMMLAFLFWGAVMADNKIEVMQEGNGGVAENGQRVTVHYEGRLTMARYESRLNSPLLPRGRTGHPRMGARCSWRNATFDRPGRAWLWRGWCWRRYPVKCNFVFDIELLEVSMPVSLGRRPRQVCCRRRKMGWL